MRCLDTYHIPAEKNHKNSTGSLDTSSMTTQSVVTTDDELLPESNHMSQLLRTLTQIIKET